MIGPWTPEDAKDVFLWHPEGSAGGLIRRAANELDRRGAEIERLAARVAELEEGEAWIVGHAEEALEYARAAEGLCDSGAPLRDVAEAVYLIRERLSWDALRYKESKEDGCVDEINAPWLTADQKRIATIESERADSIPRGDLVRALRAFSRLLRERAVTSIRAGGELLTVAFEVDRMSHDAEAGTFPPKEEL
jgi:hypothetical protein